MGEAVENSPTERVLLLECRLEHLGSALDDARADADQARAKLADAAAREADHARRYSLIQQELAEARAEIALLHERLARSEALRGELQGHLFEAGAREDAAELVRLRKEMLAQRQRFLINERTAARLRSRVDELLLSRETLLTRVAEWQGLINKEGPEAVDLAEFIAELRRDVLHLEQRDAARERQEAALRERLLRAGVDPDAPMGRDLGEAPGQAPAEVEPPSVDDAPDADPVQARLAGPGDTDDIRAADAIGEIAESRGEDEAQADDAIEAAGDEGRADDMIEAEGADPADVDDTGSPDPIDDTATSTLLEDDADDLDLFGSFLEEEEVETEVDPETVDPLVVDTTDEAEWVDERENETETVRAPPGETPMIPADTDASGRDTDGTDNDENPAQEPEPPVAPEVPEVVTAAGTPDAGPLHAVDEEPDPSSATAGPEVEGLDAADPGARAGAYERLARALEGEPSRLMDSLRSGLADPHPRVRRRAALAAATARNVPVRALLAPLRDDPDAQVRRVVREVLRHATRGELDTQPPGAAVLASRRPQAETGF